MPPFRTTDIDRRRFLGLAAAGAASGLASGRLSAAPVDLAGVTLRVAQYKGGDALLLAAAGLLDTPYRLSWSEFGSGNLMVEAMNGGAIDLAYGSEIPPIFARVSDARIRVIAVIKGDVNEQVVLVPRESGIHSIADLKGRRVGYVKATTTHYYLLKMLEEVGLSFADITPVNLTPADGRAAFEAGALDAWAIYGYSVPLTKSKTGARVLKTALGYLSGNYLYFAHPDALADAARQAAIADYLLRIRQGFLWLDDHAETFAAAQAPLIGVPREFILEMLGNVSQPRRLTAPDQTAIGSEQAVADAFVKAGIVPGPIDVRPMWDESLAPILARGVL
jgi:sulfonate transport system substrate-binding protein